MTPEEQLMTASERMLPVIDWAEGQKRMLIERGWTPDAAEAYALELLTGMTRAMFSNTK